MARRPGSDERSESPTGDATAAAAAVNAVRTSPYAIPLAALLASAHLPAAEQITLQAEPPVHDWAGDGDGE